MNESTDSLLKELKKRNDHLFDRDNWSTLLEGMIEKKAHSHCGPREYNGSMRTDAIIDICTELNNIQDKLVFQNRYRISFSEIPSGD
jgi:hypothetical protein